MTPGRTVSLIALLACAAAGAQDPDLEAPITWAEAVADGIERSRGITRETSTEVLLKRGTEQHLSGSSSMDEAIVGTCFDADLNPIKDRLPGKVRSREADESTIDLTWIESESQRNLNLGVLKLFGIGLEQATNNRYLLVSHHVTTKKWRTTELQPLDVAPRTATYCAVEATEGRVVDVLFTSSGERSASATELPAMTVASDFSQLERTYNMTYSVKVRGYKPKSTALPNYGSLNEVLQSVEAGAPLIWDVTLLTTIDKVNTKTIKKAKRTQRFWVQDASSTSIPLDSPGPLEIEVASSVGVSVSFTEGSNCKPAGEARVHRISCESVKPFVMRISNPALFGLGNAADVQLTLTEVVTP